MLKISSPPSPHSFAANTYIISNNGECAVIDPTVPYNASLLEGALKYIILTHCHFDHILELDAWAENSGCEVLISEGDAKGLSDPFVNCYMQFSGQSKGYHGRYRIVRDGEELPLGDQMLKIISTPGHSPGSAVILCESDAFVGDTVFAGGGFGRFDLPGGDYRELCKSIKRILELPMNTVLYPGHGGKTTVSEYKRFR